MTQKTSDFITQILIGVLILSIFALIGQVYSVSLQMVENKKYLVVLDENSRRIEQLENQMLNLYNTKVNE